MATRSCCKKKKWKRLCVCSQSLLTRETQIGSDVQRVKGGSGTMAASDWSRAKSVKRSSFLFFFFSLYPSFHFLDFAGKKKKKKNPCDHVFFCLHLTLIPLNVSLSIPLSIIATHCGHSQSTCLLWNATTFVCHEDEIHEPYFSWIT